MRTGHRHLPAGAGALSKTIPTGPDAVLGGCVFDPSFIPFLPFAIEPRVYPNFAGSGSASRRGSLNTDDSIEGVTHERGKISQGLGKFSHERS